ncbi:hypothetical protein CR51_22905 [Caballeronia megalochromosomata]|nr:hypothetical protein CR51_22905 [Caballeronia megalochromosomata]
MVIETLREQLQRIDALAHEIHATEHRLDAWWRKDEAAKRLTAIPGVGWLTAIAAIGDARTFRSGC